MINKEDYQLEYIRRDSYRSMRYLGDFDYVPLHQEWHNLLNTIPSFALKAPVGHAKTTNFLYYIAWLIGVKYFNPDLFIRLFCCNFRESKFRVQAVGKIINSVKYKKLFPWVKPDKNNFNKEYLMFHTPHVTKDPQLLGLGFDSQWTGIRMSDGFCDDIVDFKVSFQYETQQDYIKKFKTDLMNRMIPGAKLHYIYTPLTEIDLSWEIEDKEILPIYEYNYRNYETDGKLLWASYWTKEEIEIKKNEKPLAWKQGFLLIPLTSEQKLIFDLDLFEFAGNVLLNDYLRPTCGIDLATGRYEESGGKLDRSCMTIGFDFKTHKYIHEIILLDEEIGKLIKLVDEYDRKFNFAEIVFESNAFQYVFGDLLPDRLKRKCKASPTTSNKRDINTGLEAFSEQIKNKKVVFNSAISEEVLKEYERYPFAKHDDAVMSAWIWWANLCNLIERVCV